MKLNADDLVVSSFSTAEPDELSPITTIGPYDPTPMTMCYWCPPETVDCPIAEPILVGA